RLLGASAGKIGSKVVFLCNRIRGREDRDREDAMEGPGPAETGEDPLAPYRGRILYGLASAAAVCLLPFSVNAFVQGNPGLGAGILGAFLVLGIDALAIYLKKSPPIPLVLLLVPIAVGTAVSLKVQD